MKNKTKKPRFFRVRYTDTHEIMLTLYTFNQELTPDRVNDLIKGLFVYAQTRGVFDRQTYVLKKLRKAGIFEVKIEEDGIVCGEYEADYQYPYIDRYCK